MQGRLELWQRDIQFQRVIFIAPFHKLEEPFPDMFQSRNRPPTCIVHCRDCYWEVIESSYFVVVALDVL